MLTVTQFNELPLDERLEVLKEVAVHLDVSHRFRTYRITLFSLYNYYVEVWMRESTYTTIKAKAFENYSKLDVFLADIDLKPIYSLL